MQLDTTRLKMACQNQKNMVEQLDKWIEEHLAMAKREPIKIRMQMEQLLYQLQAQLCPMKQMSSTFEMLIKTVDEINQKLLDNE